MRRLVLVVVCLLGASPLIAQPLTKVNVGPGVRAATFGTARVQNLNRPIWSSGTMRSRVYRGATGSKGAGLYVYEYQVDLRNVVGITAIPLIPSLKLDFGPVTGTLDFNNDLVADQMFVISKGLGLGNLAPSSAVRNGNIVTVSFSPPVAGGSAPGKGDWTYMFALVSKSPPRTINATATHNLGGAPLVLQVYAPNHP